MSVVVLVTDNVGITDNVGRQNNAKMTRAVCQGYRHGRDTRPVIKGGGEIPRNRPCRLRENLLFRLLFITLLLISTPQVECNHSYENVPRRKKIPQATLRPVDLTTRLTTCLKFAG